MRINELTLISSADCNLQCEYCELNHSKDETSKTLQQNIIKAFNDGSFLNNIKTIYKKLNIEPTTTKILSLWGQEPTLTLDSFYSHIKDWLDFLPSLEKILFSTNGVAFIDKIVNLTIYLDKYITHKIDLCIQFSYDGEYSTNNIRKSKDDLIVNNVKKFISEINKLNLKYVNININFNSVISLYLINELNTSEKIKQYYNGLYLTTEEIIKEIKSSNLHFVGIGNKFEFPMMATSDDGENGYIFIKRGLKTINDNIIIKSNLYNQDLISFIKPYKNLDTFIDLVLKDKKYYYKFLNIINNMPLNCGTFYCGLKIRYDGTILNCQTHLFDFNKNKLYSDEPVEIESKKALLDYNLYPNFITADNKEIQRIEYIYNTLTNYGGILNIELYVIILKYMASIGQVKSEYLNNDKLLLKHIFLLLYYVNCPYSCQLKTGSTFLRHPGFFRFYFNGIADLMEEIFDEQLRK